MTSKNIDVGLIILCRLSSRRLPGKQLRQIRGKSALEHILDRVRRGAPSRPVVVATSTERTDDALVDFCTASGVACYRGSLNDVAGRFLACAEAHKWDFAVRINGDSVFTDPDTIREMLTISESNDYDFITNVVGRRFGVSVEIVRVAFYRQIMRTVDDPYHREHVMTWFYENENAGQRFVFENLDYSGIGELNLALDTEEDFARTVAIMGLMDREPSTYKPRDLIKLATMVSPSTTCSTHPTI